LRSCFFADRIEKRSFTMAISTWLSGTFSHSQTRRGKRRNPASRLKKARFTLEPLEARALLASYSAATVSALVADINAANTAGGANTITLTAPTTSPYVLTAAYTTGGATGLPVIAANDALTIVGNGDTIERSTAAGTPAFRLLEVASGGSLTLGNLTLQGGLVQNIDRAPGGIGGGAIVSYGTLILNGVTVQDNMAVGLPDWSTGVNGTGGGIYAAGGSITLEGGTIVQNNEAIGDSYHGAGPSLGGNGIGGGLFAIGATVTITNATLDNNAAVGGQGRSEGTGGEGGPIAGRSGHGYGGGLYASGGTVILTNTTLDDNVAKNQGGVGLLGGGYGGGLYLSASATLTNCTVQDNSALGYGQGAIGYGGGVYIAATGVSLDAATVAQVTGNTASSGAAYDNIDGSYKLS
jgi:hypothetical protein